jgi:dihydropteroate synthase
MGIETRGRVAAMARRALGAGVEIVHDAAPGGLPPRMTAVLVFDVLHLMPLADQKRLMSDILA